MTDERKAIEAIKAAVDAGKEVWAGNDCRIIKDNVGQYLVVTGWNGHTVGLHGRLGTKYEHCMNVFAHEVTIDGEPLEVK